MVDLAAEVYGGRDAADGLHFSGFLTNIAQNLTGGITQRPRHRVNLFQSYGSLVSGIMGKNFVEIIEPLQSQKKF